MTDTFLLAFMHNSYKCSLLLIDDEEIERTLEDYTQWVDITLHPSFVHILLTACLQHCKYYSPHVSCHTIQCLHTFLINLPRSYKSTFTMEAEKKSRHNVFFMWLTERLGVETGTTQSSLGRYTGYCNVPDHPLVCSLWTILFTHNKTLYVPLTLSPKVSSQHNHDRMITALLCVLLEIYKFNT